MALLLLAAAGCNESKFSYVPVSGTVTLNGEAVANARVIFMPKSSGESGEAGPYSQGDTDASGHFELRTVAKDSQRGAVVGLHRVMVTTRRAKVDMSNPESDSETVEAKETIPRPYSDYSRTPLVFEVPAGGSDAADFDIPTRKLR